MEARLTLVGRQASLLTIISPNKVNFSSVPLQSIVLAEPAGRRAGVAAACAVIHIFRNERCRLRYGERRNKEQGKARAEKRKHGK